MTKIDSSIFHRKIETHDNIVIRIQYGDNLKFFNLKKISIYYYSQYNEVAQNKSPTNSATCAYIDYRNKNEIKIREQP